MDKIYSLFIDGVLYDIYRNKIDAEKDAEIVRNKQRTMHILVKEHIILETQKY
jgi:hypothetical protein